MNWCRPTANRSRPEALSQGPTAWRRGGPLSAPLSALLLAPAFVRRREADTMQLEHTAELAILSPSKPIALKIVLSLFRRYRDLAKLQKAGKIRF